MCFRSGLFTLADTSLHCNSFSQPLTPIIRRYLNLPTNAIRPPSPPKFTRPRAASPTRSHGPGAELKRSQGPQHASLKTSKSTSHLSASAGPSRAAAAEREHKDNNTTRQPTTQIDHLYEKVVGKSKEGTVKSAPLQQSQRRPAGLHPGPTQSVRSVSAYAEIKSSGFSSSGSEKGQPMSQKKDAPFDFSAPSHPPVNEVARKPRRAPGRAVTAVPLTQTAPQTSPEPVNPTPPTVRPPTRTLSASTSSRLQPQPAPPKEVIFEEEKNELPIPTPESTTPKSSPDEEKAERAVACEKEKDEAPQDIDLQQPEPEDIQPPSAPVQPSNPPPRHALASRTALANSTNRPPMPSRAAPAKDKVTQSSGRAAFKPKRPAGASSLMASKGPSKPLAVSVSRPAPSAENELAPPTAREKSRPAAPGGKRQAASTTKSVGIRASPVKAKPKPAVVSHPVAKDSKLQSKSRSGATAMTNRKVQSSTMRRVNNATSTGVSRGTAASEAKAREAREKRRKREGVTLGKKEMQRPPQAEGDENDRKEEPARPVASTESILVSNSDLQLKMPNPFAPALPEENLDNVETIAATSDAVKISEPTSLASSSPTKLPLPEALSDLYPDSLPSPCIKPYLVPLPDASDSSLLANLSSRDATKMPRVSSPAPVVIDSRTAQAKFCFPTSAAQFSLAPKIEASPERHMEPLPSPNDTLAHRL